MGRLRAQIVRRRQTESQLILTSRTYTVAIYVGCAQICYNPPNFAVCERKVSP